MNSSEKLAKYQIAANWGVIFVSDPNSNACDHKIAISEALSGGARCVILRDKISAFEDYLSLVKQILPLIRKHAAYLFVVDNPYVALETGADGVILGQSDISIAVARDILGDGYYIGLSIKNVSEAAEAMLLDADFLLMGPVEEPMGKIDSVSDREFTWAAIASRVPVYAFGWNICSRIAEKYTMQRASGVVYIHDETGEGGIRSSVFEVNDAVSVAKAKKLSMSSSNAIPNETGSSSPAENNE